MWLIYRHDFDSLENDLGDARQKEVMGVVDTDVEAATWIKNRPFTYTFKGWDGNTYPYFSYEPIQVLTND